MNRILLVDFDGVIHSYTSPWTNAETISDPPVEGAIQALYELRKHFDVNIYSSRSSSPAGVHAIISWMAKHAGKTENEIVQDFSFPSVKPPAFLTIDDRAICFNGNWEEITVERIMKFKPWNKRGNETYMISAMKAVFKDLGKAMTLVTRLVEQQVYFSFTPYPDNEYAVEVRSDMTHLLKDLD